MRKIANHTRLRSLRCGKLSNIREIYHVVPILTIESQANSRLSKAQMIWPLVNVQLIFTNTNSGAVNPPERVALSKFETVQAKLDAAIDTCEITLLCHVKWTCIDLHAPAYLHRTFQGWQLIHADIFSLWIHPSARNFQSCARGHCPVWEFTILPSLTWLKACETSWMYGR